MTHERGAASPDRQLLVSKAWIQWAALFVLFGFFILGLLAYRTYTAGPPILALVVAEDGSAVFSGEDVRRGQRIFLSAGLMELGSIFGHGAHLGPDFTADYLRRSALRVTETYERLGERDVGARVVADRKTHPASRLLEWLRLPGDAVFIVCGVLPLLWLCWLGVGYRRPGAALAGTDTGALFTEPLPLEPEGSP